MKFEFTRNNDKKSSKTWQNHRIHDQNGLSPSIKARVKKTEQTAASINITSEDTDNPNLTQAHFENTANLKSSVR